MEWIKGRTLRDRITLEGVGIHTGEISKIVIHPSEKRGIYFLHKGELIPALHQYVVNTSFATDLGKGNKVIRTVEHLMAAFYLLGIDSAVVEILRGNEIPILDGGAKVFFEEFQRVGLEELDHYWEIIEVVFYHRIQPNGIFAELYPNPKGIFEFEGEFKFFEEKIKKKRVKVSYTDGETPEGALVGARTFCYESDVEILRANNLGLGGYYVNTLVLNENLDNLIYSTEPAYHKLLDLIGDLALVGKRIRGRIYSFKGGHSLNHSIREYLLKFGRIIKPEHTPTGI